MWFFVICNFMEVVEFDLKSVRTIRFGFIFSQVKAILWISIISTSFTSFTSVASSYFLYFGTASALLFRLPHPSATIHMHSLVASCQQHAHTCR